MRCLATVLGRLIETGFAHHIERLMVLCNFAMLAGVEPTALADWFLAFYADSHDWVVLPNVIGMGLNADGGLTATKPYIASGAYIRRMGDFCDDLPPRPSPPLRAGGLPVQHPVLELPGRARGRDPVPIPRIGPAVAPPRTDRPRRTRRGSAPRPVRFLDRI